MTEQQKLKRQFLKARRGEPKILLKIFGEQIHKSFEIIKYFSNFYSIYPDSWAFSRTHF